MSDSSSVDSDAVSVCYSHKGGGFLRDPLAVSDSSSDSSSDASVWWIPSAITRAAASLLTCKEVTGWDRKVVTPELTACCQKSVQIASTWLLNGTPIEECDEDNEPLKTCEEALCAVLSESLKAETEPLKIGKLFSCLPSHWKEHALKDLLNTRGLESFDALMYQVVADYEKASKFPFAMLQKMLFHIHTDKLASCPFLLIIKDPARNLARLYPEGEVCFPPKLVKWALGQLERCLLGVDLLHLDKITNQAFLVKVLNALPLRLLGKGLVGSGIKDEEVICQIFLEAAETSSRGLVNEIKYMQFNKEEFGEELKRFAVAMNNPFGGFSKLFDSEGNVNIRPCLFKSVLEELTRTMRRERVDQEKEDRLELLNVQDASVVVQVLEHASAVTLLNILDNRAFLSREHQMQVAYYLGVRDLDLFIDKQNELGLSELEVVLVKKRLVEKSPFKNLPLCFKEEELIFEECELKANVDLAASSYLSLYGNYCFEYESLLSKIPLRFQKKINSLFGKAFASEAILPFVKENLIRADGTFHILMLVSNHEDYLDVSRRLLPVFAISPIEQDLAEKTLEIVNPEERIRCFDMLNHLFSYTYITQQYHGEYRNQRLNDLVCRFIIPEIAKCQNQEIFDELKHGVHHFTELSDRFGGNLASIAKLPIREGISEAVLKEFSLQLHGLLKGVDRDAFMAQLAYFEIENVEARVRAFKMAKDVLVAGGKAFQSTSWVFSHLIPEIARCRNQDIRDACKKQFLRPSALSLPTTLIEYQELTGGDTSSYLMLPLLLVLYKKHYVREHLIAELDCFKGQLFELRHLLKDKLNGLEQALNLACLGVSESKNRKKALTLVLRALQFREQSIELEGRKLEIEAKALNLKTRKKLLKQKKQTFHKQSIRFLGEGALRIPTDEKVKKLAGRPTGLGLLAYQIAEEDKALSVEAARIEEDKAQFLVDQKIEAELNLSRMKCALGQLSFLFKEMNILSIPDDYTDEMLSELVLHVWQEKLGVDVRGIEDFQARYTQYFDSGRMKGILAAYTGKDILEIKRYLGTLIRETMLGNFKAFRYEPVSEHLRILSEKFPELYLKWQTPGHKEAVDGATVESVPLTQEGVQKVFRNALEHDHYGTDDVYKSFVSYLKTGELPEEEELTEFTKTLLELNSCPSPTDEMLKEVLAMLLEREEQPQIIFDIQALIEKTCPRELENKSYVIDSDDLADLFLCGTEVTGSCQRVEGSANLNKCLLGYVGDGKNRVIAVKDNDGKILQRRIFRLLLDDAGNPALFLERRYGVYSAQFEDAILRVAKRRAAELDLPLYEQGMSGHVSLHSLGSNAPFEYSDASSTDHVARAGAFRIDRVHLLN